MLKKTITYVDYDNVERTEEFHFNLSKAELMEMNLGQSGGLLAVLTKITETQDIPKIMEQFKQIILKSYGEKSLDGKRFIKSPQMTEEFTQTEAYSQLFMELSTNDMAAAAFIKGIVPSDISAQLPDDPQKVKSLPSTNIKV